MQSEIKAALWSQGLSATAPDYYVINGVSSRDSESKEQTDALIMMNTMQLPLVKKHREGDDSTSSFKVKKDKDWFYSEGNFNETDFVGRLRVYRFLIHSNNGNEVISTLQSYAETIGCSIQQHDLKEISQIFNNKHNKTIIILCSIIIAMAIALLLR